MGRGEEGGGSAGEGVEGEGGEGRWDLDQCVDGFKGDLFAYRRSCRPLIPPLLRSLLPRRQPSSPPPHPTPLLHLSCKLSLASTFPLAISTPSPPLQQPWKPSHHRRKPTGSCGKGGRWQRSREASGLTPRLIGGCWSRKIRMMQRWVLLCLLELSSKKQATDPRLSRRRPRTTSRSSSSSPPSSPKPSESSPASFLPTRPRATRQRPSSSIWRRSWSSAPSRPCRRKSSC